MNHVGDWWTLGKQAASRCSLRHGTLPLLGRTGRAGHRAAGGHEPGHNLSWQEGSQAGRAVERRLPGRWAQGPAPLHRPRRPSTAPWKPVRLPGTAAEMAALRATRVSGWGGRALGGHKTRGETRDGPGRTAPDRTETLPLLAAGAARAAEKGRGIAQDEGRKRPGQPGFRPPGPSPVERAGGAAVRPLCCFSCLAVLPKFIALILTFRMGTAI